MKDELLRLAERALAAAVETCHGNDCLKARTQELWPEGEPELGGQEYDL